MGKENKDITILTIGDKVDFDTYMKSDREKESFIKLGFNYVTTDYRHVLKADLPEIMTKKVIVFLFFPFYYWNRHIEHKRYKGVYGNKTFYNKFSKFWKVFLSYSGSD